MVDNNSIEVLIDGIKEKAKLIDVIVYKQERYAIYSLLKENELNDIYISKIISTKSGDKLVNNIEDEAKEYILNIINN